jgi:hypothetical protein
VVLYIGEYVLIYMYKQTNTVGYKIMKTQDTFTNVVVLYIVVSVLRKCIVSFQSGIPGAIMNN